MSKKISTVLSISIIIIIASGIAGLLWYGARNIETPDTNNIIAPQIKIKNQPVKAMDTTSWKKYQNTTYGYDIKYPADWQIITLGNVEPATFSAPDFDSPGCSNDAAKICARLSIGNIHQAENGETIVSDINLNSNDRIILKKNIKISGDDASFIEYFQANYGRKDGGVGLIRQEIKTIHNGTVYRIYIDEYNADINKIKTSADWENKNILDAMLASFNFSDKPAVAENNNSSNAYKNDQYGFTLTFPETWKGYNSSSYVGDARMSETISFSFSSLRPFTIIQILVFTKDQWNGWMNKRTENIIGSNDKYVIWYDGDLKDCSGGGQYDSFQTARCKEIPQILKTFKMAK